MSGEEVPVELQLKGLKAAYREAIGVAKKNNKGKNRKKLNAQQDSENVHLTASNGDCSSADRQENGEGSLVSRMRKSSICDDLTLKLGGKNAEASDEQSVPAQSMTASKVAEVVDQRPVQPIARTTRRQAKAQEGPYEDSLADTLRQNGGSDTGRSEDADMRKNYDFLMSLIAGRSTGPSSSLKSSISGRSMKSGQAADDRLFLAEEALRKASKELIEQKNTITQLTGIALEAEPKGLKENVKDQQSIQYPAKQATDSVKLREDEDEDSFVEEITSRSPSKPLSGPRDSLEVKSGHASRSPSKSAMVSAIEEASTRAGDDDQDSFVEHISSRSPAKLVSRIEDSVEALDQMEEVEEALHEAAMAERLVSPEKKRQKREQPGKQSTVVSTKAASDPKTTQPPPVKTGFHTMQVKPAPKRASIIKKATSMTFKPSQSSETSSLRDETFKNDKIMKTAPVKRPTSLLPPKEPVKSTKPATRPTNFELPGEAIARKLKEQRERRLAQRESSEDSFRTARTFSGPNIKSTKPLTKPTFELPGEALSRKKREANEAKLKAQEEEERKRREFKAKPVRKSIVSCVRDTVASRARQSKIGLESMEDGNLSVSKRSSVNVGAHRPSILELANMVANTSAPPVKGPPAPLERKPSTKFHGPSMSGLAMQRTVSATEVQIQRQRAKEIYNRDQKLAEDIEREKREREAAAKRSREEAAERGRQASREWAEKQRAKKLAEGDKGMSAGYGPGGQMGLSA
jgi:hypothetical protein